MNRITTRYEKENATGKVRKWVIALGLVIGQILALTPQASAEVLVNRRLPFTALVFNDCTGEDIRFAGEFHEVLKSRVDKNGTFHGTYDVNAHGEGEGLTTGNRYIWNDTYMEEFVNPQGCAFTLTSPDFYLRLISQGSLPNQLLKVNRTFGLDANCQFFSSLDVELRCAPKN